MTTLADEQKKLEEEAQHSIEHDDDARIASTFAAAINAMGHHAWPVEVRDDESNELLYGITSDDLDVSGLAYYVGILFERLRAIEGRQSPKMVRDVSSDGEVAVTWMADGDGHQENDPNRIARATARNGPE